MLVADYVNPRMADKLQKQRVQFIDRVGNACIDQSPVAGTARLQRPDTSMVIWNPKWPPPLA
jgi:hypothetical protein